MKIKLEIAVYLIVEASLRYKNARK